MTESVHPFRGVAVDVGNSAVHVGLFDRAPDKNSQPREVVILNREDLDFSKLLPMIDEREDAAAWHIASVNDEVLAELIAWLDHHAFAGQRTTISHTDVPIGVDVAQPEKVGIDRLLGAAAAHALLEDGSPAIIVDAGTAITVDCVFGGAFRGGAILPGMRMAAAALDRYTQRLPRVDADAIEVVEVIGGDTKAAMASGIYWGALGAVRELVKRMSDELLQPPRIVITGGDGPRLAPRIDNAVYVPHLVLAGIALTAAHGQSPRQ